MSEPQEPIKQAPETLGGPNSGKMKGAIAADTIRFNNSVVFELTDAVKDSAPETNGGIDRGNWVECRPQPTLANDPESGC